MNLFDSDISIEKMAAFLDGNLSDAEMRNMSSVIENDDFLRGFVQESCVVDESISALPDFHLDMPENLQYGSFHLPSFDDSSDLLTFLNYEHATEGMQLGVDLQDVFDDPFHNNSSDGIININKLGDIINTNSEHNSLLELGSGDLSDNCSAAETFNENI